MTLVALAIWLYWGSWLASLRASQVHVAPLGRAPKLLLSPVIKRHHARTVRWSGAVHVSAMIYLCVRQWCHLHSATVPVQAHAQIRNPALIFRLLHYNAVADSYNRWVVRRRRTNSITVVVSTWRSNNGRRQRWRLTSYVSNNDDVNADCWDKTWRIHSKLMSAAFARCHCQQRAALIVHRYSTRTPSSFTRASHTLIDLPLANSRRCHRDGPTRYPNQSKRWIILRKNKTLHCIAADSDDKRWRDE